VHKRCSGIQGSLQVASPTFRCKQCMRTEQNGGGVQDGNTVDCGNDIVLERVGKFCYLGDMLNADGGVDSAVVARIRCGWNKFRELAPILTHKGASLIVTGKVYESCVRSAMIYGSETWAVKTEHIQRLSRTEMRMIRWMCGVSVKERRSNEELRRRLGVAAIADVMRRNRLRWFGHVERKDDEDWVKRCTGLQVSGVRRKGRPRKTWGEVVGEDMSELGLDRGDAQNRAGWKRVICGENG